MEWTIHIENKDSLQIALRTPIGLAVIEMNDSRYYLEIDEEKIGEKDSLEEAKKLATKYLRGKLTELYRFVMDDKDAAWNKGLTGVLDTAMPPKESGWLSSKEEWIKHCTCSYPIIRGVGEDEYCSVCNKPFNP